MYIYYHNSIKVHDTLELKEVYAIIDVEEEKGNVVLQTFGRVLLKVLSVSLAFCCTVDRDIFPRKIFSL